MTGDAAAEREAMLRRLAAGLDVPTQMLGLDQPMPRPPHRERIACHVGQAGWRIGYTVTQAGNVLARAGHRLTAAGHHAQRAGDRLIDAGDALAAKVAGR